MTQLREVPMFLVGISLLAVLLYSSYQLPSLEYNIIWMVVTSLSAAVVMAFLPFSAEFNIPGWAKFGGSAAIFVGCLYLTFGLAEKDLNKENIELRNKVQELGGQLKVVQNAADQCSARAAPLANATSSLSAGIQNVIQSIGTTRDLMTNARQAAYGATTNTSDVRGCVAAASTAVSNADSALKQLDATARALSALPR